MLYEPCLDLNVLENLLVRNRTALLVVDAQNDFCSERGLLKATGADLAMIQDIVPNLTRFVEITRAQSIPVFFLVHINSPATMSEAWLSRDVWQCRNQTTLCRENTWGSEIIADIKAKEEDIIIEKHRYSGFVGTKLDLILRTKNIKSLIITGVSTNVCVDSTVRDAFMRDYFVVVPEDCTASSIEELHHSSLITLSKYFATVTRSENIVRLWQNRALGEALE